MNNKIHELAIEADEWMSNTANWRHIIGNPNIIRDCKFVELIIIECLNIGKEIQEQDISNATIEYNLGREMGIEVFMNQIKKEFGVE